jgi:hypothetical protein
MRDQYAFPTASERDPPRQCIGEVAHVDEAAARIERGEGQRPRGVGDAHEIGEVGARAGP